MKFISLFPIIFLWVGCSHSLEDPPRYKDPTEPHYANKEELYGYQIPLDGKERPNRIQGQLLLEMAPAPLPLRHKKLVLLRQGTPILEARTDSSGYFQFIGKIPEGIYRIEIESERYGVEYWLKVKAEEMDGVQVFATRK